MESSETLDPRLLHLAPVDNVYIAIATLPAGERLVIKALEAVVVREPIPLGFKIAARPIAPGQKIIKYGAAIGSATCAIAPGELVHLHNMKSDYLPTWTLEPGRSYVQSH